LELVLATEIVLAEQQKHLPRLFEEMQYLINMDGSPLDIYIFSYAKIQSYTTFELVGLTTIIQYKGYFTSCSPKFQANFPQLACRENAVAIHLKKGVKGDILSHEFGHLHYLYNNWTEYKKYISKKGDDYVIGGHGEFDPSGISARIAESGKMPE